VCACKVATEGTDCELGAEERNALEGAWAGTLALRERKKKAAAAKKVAAFAAAKRGRRKGGTVKARTGGTVKSPAWNFCHEETQEVLLVDGECVSETMNVCNFCGFNVGANSTRFIAHLLGVKGEGVCACKVATEGTDCELGAEDKNALEGAWAGVVALREKKKKRALAVDEEEQAAKKARTDGKVNAGKADSTLDGHIVSWSGAQQREYEDNIMELIAAVDLPLSFVDNPAYHKLIAHVNPLVKFKDRKYFEDTVLPRVYTRTKAEANMSFNTVEGADTITLDGFAADSGVTNCVNVGRVRGGKYEYLATIDAGKMRDDKDAFVKTVHKAFDRIMPKWTEAQLETKINGVVGDNASHNMAGMRELVKWHNWMVTSGSAAHTFDLICESLVELAPVAEVLAKCKEIVAFVRSSDYVHSLYRECRAEQKGPVLKPFPETGFKDAYEHTKIVAAAGSTISAMLDDADWDGRKPQTRAMEETTREFELLPSGVWLAKAKWVSTLLEPVAVAITCLEDNDGLGPWVVPLANAVSEDVGSWCDKAGNPFTSSTVAGGLEFAAEVRETILMRMVGGTLPGKTRPVQAWVRTPFEVLAWILSPYTCPAPMPPLTVLDVAETFREYLEPRRPGVARAALNTEVDDLLREFNVFSAFVRGAGNGETSTRKEHLKVQLTEKEKAGTSSKVRRVLQQISKMPRSPSRVNAAYDFWAYDPDAAMRFPNLREFAMPLMQHVPNSIASERSVKLSKNIKTPARERMGLQKWGELTYVRAMNLGHGLEDDGEGLYSGVCEASEGDSAPELRAEREAERKAGEEAGEAEEAREWAAEALAGGSTSAVVDLGEDEPEGGP